MDDPQKIADMLNHVFCLKNKTEEYVYLLSFNTKYKLLGVFEVSHGTVDQSILNPREVFMKAMLSGATSIVLVHNDPSGDPSPSRLDHDCQQRIQKAGEILGIPLVDFLIVADEGFVSFAEGF